jgi:hypothetical protein
MGYVKIAIKEMLKLSLKRGVGMRTVFIRLGTGTTVNMVMKSGFCTKQRISGH